MANFRDKAREIKVAAEQERGNFEPTGAPMRLYNYWLDETQSKKGRSIRCGSTRENFCHFWRVVAIWAPLMFVFRKLESVLSNPLVLATLGVLAAIAVVTAGVTFSEFGMILLIILAAFVGIAVGLVGIFSGISMAQDDDATRRENDLPSRDFAKWGMLAFPAAVPAFLLTKFFRSDYVAEVIFTLLGLAILGAIVVGIVTEGFLSVVIVLGIIVGLLVALVAAAILMSVLSDFIAGRRKIAKKKALDARYDYYDEHGHFPEDEEKEPREPGKISKFFTGVGDFIIFITQVVRVNKWKICPLVEVDTK